MKILIFPKGDNPYQELLYRELRKAHTTDSFTYYQLSALRLLFFPLLVFMYRLRGYSVFHIHWPAFAINRPIPGIKYISLTHALLCLTSLRLLGYQIVWTVHNVLPHSAETSNDTLVARYLANIASMKIASSRMVKDEMLAKGLDASRLTVIPHGNYVGWYPQGATKAESRKKFGIPHNAFVAVFVGRIEPYKNVPELLSACRYVATKQPVHLLIGGKAQPDIAAQLRAQATDTIHLELRFIDDSELQYFFAAADVAVYPFTEITTSGSVLLALSFGVPIVAPRIGALTDIPDAAGFLYDPSKQTLQKVLERVVSQPQKIKNARISAREYCETLNWHDIAKKTYRLYAKVDRNGRI